MIAKERRAADHPDPDEFTKAGVRAEEQMAFYLKRAFGSPDNKDVMVFHDLRLMNDNGDDAAQIDHLVVYRSGMIVIESKSVTSRVRINRQGEWDRFWDGQWKGMSSPLLQAKRQVEFLHALLREHRTEMRRKMAVIGMQYGFKSCPFDVIVAVSDNGSIDRGDVDYSDVVKAEAVVDRVRDLVAKRTSGLLKSLVVGDEFEKLSDDEMIRVRDFLKRRHTPAVSSQPKPIVPPPRPPVAPPSKQGVQGAAVATVSPLVAVVQPADLAAKACRHCRSSLVAVDHGKYGYYLKCRDCDKNTRIDFACGACGKEARIRKEKERFFRECASCNRQELYHVNPQ